VKTGNQENRVFFAATVNYTITSPDLPQPSQQLTTTGIAGAEEIKDSMLDACRRPPPKHSMSLARVA